ncbi:hypothetical protein NVP1063O_211 [Vibrio phage 1.063.O._10N.261.45.C7]|nr:hypothetical protein NVP1063O_211 [Vibrio phage 1.063.O._10N.261.45.C7]
MDDYKEQQIGMENHPLNTSYLWKEPELPKSTFSKEELDLKYGKWSEWDEMEFNQPELTIQNLTKEWSQSKHEAVESELKSYLESVHKVDCKQVEQYIKTCNNVKLKGVDIHSVTSPTGYTDWYDAGVLIFTSGEELQGTVLTLQLKGIGGKYESY